MFGLIDLAERTLSKGLCSIVFGKVISELSVVLRLSQLLNPCFQLLIPLFFFNQRFIPAHPTICSKKRLWVPKLNLTHLILSLDTTRYVEYPLKELANLDFKLPMRQPFDGLGLVVERVDDEGTDE